jgi:hypothetical protein
LCSVFGDIFDEDHFISSLAHQVRILRELPKEVMMRFENISMIPRVKVRAWSLPRFYLETALPALKQHGCVEELVSLFFHQLIVLPSIVLSTIVITAPVQHLFNEDMGFFSITMDLAESLDSPHSQTG